ncbi:hypothetical protein DIPPA_03860 [Diplonema papillatum]|nr:hypothetical protein DIPPA_03860 [Diplonema papillatum]
MDLGNECCPISRRFMKKEELRANVALKAEIDDWAAARRSQRPTMQNDGWTPGRTGVRSNHSA